MTRQTWEGSDKAKDVLLTKIPNNEDDTYDTISEVDAGRDGESDLITKQNAQDSIISATTTEVTNARDGEANLLAQIDALQAAILAVTAANGSLISSNDNTPGFLNGKLVAGDGMTFTENNDGGNETMTVETDGLTDTFMMGF